jgi:hypothetical protein
VSGLSPQEHQAINRYRRYHDTVERHNLVLRRMLFGAALYGVLATLVALWGWMR